MKIVSQDLWRMNEMITLTSFRTGREENEEESNPRSNHNKCFMNRLKMYDKCNVAVRDGDGDDEINRFSLCVPEIWNEMK